MVVPLASYRHPGPLQRRKYRGVMTHTHIAWQKCNTMQFSTGYSLRENVAERGSEAKEWKGLWGERVRIANDKRAVVVSVDGINSTVLYGGRSVYI